MRDQGMAWADSVLGVRHSEVTELHGGLSSTTLALTYPSGEEVVLRLMTNEPWRTYGAELTRRESAAQHALAVSPVPAPRSIALDPDGSCAGVPAHLMSRLPGTPTGDVDDAALAAMAEMLATIHAFQPAQPFRTYQSWAHESKWTVPDWAEHPESWRRAFALLSEQPPPYEPALLHRDYSHRNLLWLDGAISGVVDWVETSTGPAWLDAGHAATNLAVTYGLEQARDFVAAFAARCSDDLNAYWLVVDAVAFLPPPGKEPLFGTEAELYSLDSWLHYLMT